MDSFSRGPKRKGDVASDAGYMLSGYVLQKKTRPCLTLNQFCRNNVPLSGRSRTRVYHRHLTGQGKQKIIIEKAKSAYQKSEHQVDKRKMSSIKSLDS